MSETMPFVFDSVITPPHDCTGFENSSSISVLRCHEYVMCWSTAASALRESTTSEGRLA